MNRKRFLTLATSLILIKKNWELTAEDTMREIKAIPMREIPSSREKIPVLGFGTWRVFDKDSTKENLITGMEVWEKFKEHGGKLIDSSPMYGRSEEFIGNLFEKKKEENRFLATKVWTSGKKEGSHQINQSFQKMKTSFIDLFQIHNLLDWKTQMDTLRELKAEGKIKYIGVTHYIPTYFKQIEEIIRKEKIDFIQIPYSISLRDAENSISPLAREKGIAVLINRPFEGGELFSNFIKKPIDPRLKEFDIHSWAELFIRFLVANRDLTCILFASFNSKHVEENMNAAKKPLLEKKDLEKVYKIFLEN